MSRYIEPRVQNIVSYVFGCPCPDRTQRLRTELTPEMVRSSCELCVRFTGSEEEWEEVRALLELGRFLLPQMNRMDTDISDVVTDSWG